MNPLTDGSILSGFLHNLTNDWCHKTREPPVKSDVGETDSRSCSTIYLLYIIRHQIYIDESNVHFISHVLYNMAELETI